MNPQRLITLRRRLEGAGCDVFCSFSPPVNEYLTGFRGTTSALIAGSECLFLCDSRYTEQAQGQVDAAFSVEEVKGDLIQRAAERLNQLGLKNAVAYDPAVLRVSELQTLQGTFAGALRAMPGLSSTLRWVKDAEEIEKIRRASALAEGVLADILGELREGVREREVAARFEYEFKRRGASGASFDTIALFGSRSSLPHGAPGDRALKNGDVILFDFGCRLDGYCSDLTRTYAFGSIPGPWFEEIYGVTLAAQAAAMAAIRPGMTGREVDAIARTRIEEAGFGPYFGHGLGHGLGIEIHESPRLNSESDATLEPGMVVTVEPGIYLPGRGGVRIEDVVAVTESGCETLSATNKKFRILEL